MRLFFFLVTHIDGNPIRSKVSLRIRQETKKDTYWAYYWEEAFQAFVSFDKNHPPDSGR